MNKIDFDSFFDTEKKKKKEAKKQLKASIKRKPLNSTTNIDNKTSETKDITDIGYKLSGMKNKLDLSTFNEKEEIILFFRKINPKIQINFNNTDLYSVKNILNKMKNTIHFADQELERKIRKDMLIINKLIIKNYLSDYTDYMQNITYDICLFTQKYFKIISFERYNTPRKTNNY